MDRKRGRKGGDDTRLGKAGAFRRARMREGKGVVGRSVEVGEGVERSCPGNAGW